MPSESERVVAAYFHAVRSARKHKPVYSQRDMDQIRVILDRRMRIAALEESADRHDYEREQE